MAPPGPGGRYDHSLPMWRAPTPKSSIFFNWRCQNKVVYNLNLDIHLRFPLDSWSTWSAECNLGSGTVASAARQPRMVNGMAGPKAKDMAECRLEGSGSAARGPPLTLRSKLPSTHTSHIHTHISSPATYTHNTLFTHLTPTYAHPRRAAGRLTAKSGKLKLKPQVRKVPHARTAS